jgi:hypothetical protein
MWNSYLGDAWLYRASLRSASLSGASMNGANLTEANLAQADLRKAKLREALLVGTDLARARRAIEHTIEHLRRALGDEAWLAGMHPEIPDTKVLDNPYTYTDYADASTHSA